MFYPWEAKPLTAAVEAFLAEARALPEVQPAKAIIAPHAGFDYSGPIAGSAYACLLNQAKAVTRVILLGPSHHVAFSGVAASHAAAFETPLGAAPVDRGAIAGLLKEGLIVENDAAHAQEHSLEVQLPFLQRILPNARVVPLLTGDDDFRLVATILEALWGGPETVVVVSSDLSHFNDYRTACRMDRETAQTIEAGRAGAVGFKQACGATPVNGLLQVASDKGLSVATVDLRNSGDTAGSRDRVVGYGAFVFG
jgi:MEMO1 family protein